MILYKNDDPVKYALSKAVEGLHLQATNETAFEVLFPAPLPTVEPLAFEFSTVKREMNACRMVLRVSYYYSTSFEIRYLTSTVHVHSLITYTDPQCNRILSSKINFMENNNHLPVFDITIAIENVEG